MLRTDSIIPYLLNDEEEQTPRLASKIDLLTIMYNPQAAKPRRTIRGLA
jgi:hypothetical protein